MDQHTSCATQLEQDLIGMPPRSSFRVESARFNEALQHAWSAALSAHLKRGGHAFSPTLLAEAVASAPNFPVLSIGEFIHAACTAGIGLRGVSIERGELTGLSLPLLTFLGTSVGAEARMALTEIVRIGPKKVVVARDMFGETSIPRGEFETRWSGILLMVENVRDDSARYGRAEREFFQSEIKIHDHFLHREDCRALIDYCEKVAFARSRIQSRRGGVAAPIVDTRIRNSSSAVLRDRNHPLLAMIYRGCSEIEGLPVHLIENLQCVRYRNGQRFRTHFDSSSEHPRAATYLLYLNEDFEGGETVFPQVDQRVQPREGRCLRFPDCEPDGRTLWASEHGGLPVTQGVKYALNIWFRCEVT